MNKKTINQQDLRLAEKASIVFFEQKNKKFHLFMKYDFAIETWRLYFGELKDEIKEYNGEKSELMKKYNKFAQKYFIKK